MIYKTVTNNISQTSRQNVQLKKNNVCNSFLVEQSSVFINADKLNIH